MNKKGTHVDWVISMGIFLVYVFALFILLRPGIKPVHRPITLLNILEENFEKEVMWAVKMVPLFIRTCPASTVESPSSIKINFAEGSSTVWRFRRAVDSAGASVESGLGTSFNYECISSNPSVIYLYLSQGENVKYDPDEKLNLEEAECTSAECDVEVGIMEDIKGINSVLLGLITSDIAEDYELLHDSWGIPEGKGFAVLEDTNKIIGAKPETQANVFVRKITTQKVTSEGDLTPTAIYLQIW